MICVVSRPRCFHFYQINARPSFSSPTQEKILLTLCVDSKSLYDCLVKLGTAQEKWLMIDLFCLRQSHERREITEILWIKEINIPADGITKEKPCDALQRIIETNEIDIDIKGWVERDNLKTEI